MRDPIHHVDQVEADIEDTRRFLKRYVESETWKADPDGFAGDSRVAIAEVEVSNLPDWAKNLAVLALWEQTKKRQARKPTRRVRDRVIREAASRLVMTQGEEADIAPVIKVAITTGKSENPTRIIGEDNGPGIPPEIIGGIIDYDIRVSSREAYISPTRGRQGNALKTILPMAYVLGGGIKGETWIEARGLKHRIPFTVNQDQARADDPHRSQPRKCPPRTRLRGCDR